MKRVMAQEGAAGIAAAVAESVQYQGRKASRQGSEQRRQDILDAAMRIVVRDGVRAVPYRSWTPTRYWTAKLADQKMDGDQYLTVQKLDT